MPKKTTVNRFLVPRGEFPRTLAEGLRRSGIPAPHIVVGSAEGWSYGGRADQTGIEQAEMAPVEAESPAEIFTVSAAELDSVLDDLLQVEWTDEAEAESESLSA